MKYRIVKLSAIVVFIVFLPLMLIESIILNYSDNPVWRIKRNFQVVMLAINLGQPKSTSTH